MKIFNNVEQDFGRPSAVCERSTIMPDQWWKSYGCGALNLQKLAIRILSQTCSFSGCECNWSTFEHIHSKRGIGYSIKNLMVLFMFITT
ncbi:hypothetical protein AHAS_Ahas20G0199600 [Arachis hypogaea]